MNIPIYYTCFNCKGSFPYRDYDMEEELCTSCSKELQKAKALLQKFRKTYPQLVTWWDKLKISVDKSTAN